MKFNYALTFGIVITSLFCQILSEPIPYRDDSKPIQADNQWGDVLNKNLEELIEKQQLSHGLPSDDYTSTDTNDENKLRNFLTLLRNYYKSRSKLIQLLNENDVERFLDEQNPNQSWDYSKPATLDRGVQFKKATLPIAGQRGKNLASDASHSWMQKLFERPNTDLQKKSTFLTSAFKKNSDTESSEPKESYLKNWVFK